MAESPSADELLAHTDWLHQLARALVGDAGAEDVVQATYEVALTKPPREAGPLRPWLGGVARNLARMATRGRIRREAREVSLDALGASEVPTPEQLVERVQMQQQVGRIVLELPEPLRATLLLRFFEGLSAADIARAQGIPAATVRGRIKDALDRVRATLDARHDRRRWALLLAPIAAPVGSSAPAGTAALVTGGLVVKTATKLGIAVVVVLALVLGTRWIGWWGGGGDDAPIATAGSGAAPGPGSAPSTPAVTSAPGPARSFVEIVHDDDPEGTLRLEGQVIDEHEAPVGGARVAIDAHPPIVVETEPNGVFVFEGLIPRDYRLEATSGEGYAGPAKLRLTAETEPVTLRLRRGGAVEVVVTAAETGKPVAGAEVELRSTLTWAGRTDAKGSVVLRGVGAVWAPLAVRAPGFAPAGMMLGTSGDPAAPARVTLALAGGAAIAGRVVDERGAPLAGARVVATSASEPFPIVDPRRDGVVSGADGSFQLPKISAGTWRLTATHGDHAPATSEPLSVDGTHARTGIELVLAEGGVVRGIVKDRGGQPIAAADVRVVVRGHLDWRARRQAFTGADGAFAIAGLPRRAMDVVAGHESGASAVVPVELGATREHDVTLTLDVAGAIEGVVVDASGAPIGDAQVAAEPEWTGGTEDRALWAVRGIPETVTDQGGRFRFAGLPDATYRVRAARPGAPEGVLALGAGTSARPGGAPLRLVVDTDGRVVGKVALPDGKAPRRFLVSIGGMHPLPFAGGDGAFAIPAPAGAHAIVISGPGFVEKTLRDVAVVAGKDTDVGAVAVAAGRSISGRVLDAQGAPVAKARVAAGSMLTGGGRELYIPDESPGAKDAETDEAGRFLIEGFSPGAVTIVAGKPDVGRSASVRIPPGPDSATLDLVLQPTTGLDGKVTRAGAPAGDVVVIASPVGATQSNFFVVTGADGSFALDALAPGAYFVYAMVGTGGGRPKDMYARRVDVPLGTRPRVELDTTPGPLAMTVHVKSAAGPAMAQVITMQAAIAPATMDELRDGSQLPAGGVLVPIYLRGAMGSPVELTGLRPGVHTACAIPMVPGIDDPSQVPLRCTQVKLEAGRPAPTVEVLVQIPK